MIRSLFAAGFALLIALPAQAGSGISVGIWSSGGDHYRDRHDYRRHPGWGHRVYPPYYRPHRSIFYGPPTVYVARPPRVVYVPAPVPSYGTITPAAPRQCTQFNGDATFDGSGTPFFGRACLFADGRWHIVP